MLRRRLAHDLGDPEVEELDAPVRAAEHFPGFTSRCTTPFAWTASRAESTSKIRRRPPPTEGVARAELGVQRPPQEALGDDEGAPVRGGPEVVRGHDVRVGDKRQGPRLHPHPIRRVGDRPRLLARPPPGASSISARFCTLTATRPEDAVVALEHLRHAAGRDLAEDPGNARPQSAGSGASAPVTGAARFTAPLPSATRSLSPSFLSRSLAARSPIPNFAPTSFHARPGDA